MDKLIAWLLNNVPEGDTTTVVHGDFRLVATFKFEFGVACFRRSDSEEQKQFFLNHILLKLARRLVLQRCVSYRCYLGKVFFFFLLL